MRRLVILLFLLTPCRVLAAPVVIVAEGERFAPSDDKGWRVTAQDDTYGSHTYGGMWMTHGGCLGAKSTSDGSVATQSISVPQAGKYRVWSKYQAPPYFNYLHRIEVVQQGKVLFSHVYGKAGTPRLWSFSGKSDELYWYWGMDHDAAEAPPALVDLAAGPAEVRLVTVKNTEPAGDRFIDFVLLTTEPKDTYIGFQPYAVGSPFANEALATSKLYMRFRNTSKSAAQLNVSRAGHFQPNYGGATAKYPEKATASGEWSEWVNVGPFCRLVHDEGLTLTLPGTSTFPVQFALDTAGKHLVGDLTATSGEAVVVPIDITWRKDAQVRASKDLAADLIKAAQRWRRANGGKRPQQILFYGAFSGNETWVGELKHALGYNTLLPAGYEQVKKAFVAQHYGSPAAIRGLAKSMKDAKERLRVVSFGDEIGLGRVNYGDPKIQPRYRDWLAKRGVTEKDLGGPLDKAVLSDATGRSAWFSQLFNEDVQFATYREMTELSKQLFGPDVLTGANFSPHHPPLYYGHIHQWVDLFKARGMSMFWAEDYIFSVPEAPQIISWMFSQIRCATKYHRQPIHFYVMPHAPGQVPDILRKNLLTAIGNGTAHVDHFWVAPAERFTENYVSWRYPETFRVLSETIFDAAEVEKIQQGGTVRPARVAVLTGKATDFHESRLQVDKNIDPFLKRCQNAPPKVKQTLGRKDQQHLYLALRHAQHAVDLITEDDVAEGALASYEVVYFAGEWIDRRAVKKLDEWVKAGGTLYAAAGLGQRNELDEVDDGLLRLLGLKSATNTKNAIEPRTLLELPLMEPIDTLTLGEAKVPVVGMKQVLTPAAAKVLGKWSDGGAAVTEHTHGKGKAFAVGTLPGASYMRTGLRRVPYARGGRHVVYNPVDFSADATKLALLGLQDRNPQRAAWTDNPGVEAIVLDNKGGSLLTLVNWTNGPIKGLAVNVRQKAKSQVRSVVQGKEVTAKHDEGVTRFTLDLAEGDFLLLRP